MIANGEEGFVSICIYPFQFFVVGGKNSVRRGGGKGSLFYLFLFFIFCYWSLQELSRPPECFLFVGYTFGFPIRICIFVDYFHCT